MVDERGRLAGFAALLDVSPEVEEEAEVAAKLFFAGSFGCGANDEAAGGFALFAEENFFQAATLTVGLDLAGDAGVVDGRHEDEEAGRGRAMCEVMRAPFLAMGSWRSETRISWPGLRSFADGGEIGGLHGGAATTARVAAHRRRNARGRLRRRSGGGRSLPRSLRPNGRPSRRPSRRPRLRSPSRLRSRAGTAMPF